MLLPEGFSAGKPEGERMFFFFRHKVNMRTPRSNIKARGELSFILHLYHYFKKLRDVKSLYR